MGGRRSDGTLSQTAGAKRRRAARAAAKTGDHDQELEDQDDLSAVLEHMSAPELLVEHMSAPALLAGQVSHEPIGVSKQDRRTVEPVQDYHCNNCQGMVAHLATLCPTCELKLEWPE